MVSATNSFQYHRFQSAIIEMSPDAIIGTDTKGIVRSWNQGATRMYGYSAEEMLGKDVLLLVPKSRRRTHILEVQKKVRQGKCLSNLLSKVVTKDGRLIPISLSMSPILDEEEETVGIASIARDLSFFIRKQEKLQKVNSELENLNLDLEIFASSASHDLKAPLHSLFGFVELIEKKVTSENPKHSIYLEKLFEGLGRLLKLIEGLDRFGKLNQGIINKTKISTNELVDETCDNLEPLIHFHRAQVKVEKLPSLFGDRELILHIFQNILSNAIKFKKRQSPPIVRIFAQEKSDRSVICIEDNGRGMCEKDLRRIWRPFKRGQNAEQTPGSGIGLSICKRIMEAHGGCIQIESVYEKGSLFKLEFPIPEKNTNEKAKTSQ